MTKACRCISPVHAGQTQIGDQCICNRLVFAMAWFLPVGGRWIEWRILLWTTAHKKTSSLDGIKPESGVPNVKCPEPVPNAVCFSRFDHDLLECDAQRGRSVAGREQVLMLVIGFFLRLNQSLRFVENRVAPKLNRIEKTCPQGLAMQFANLCTPIVKHELVYA